MRISLNFKSEEAKLIFAFADANGMRRDKAVAHFLRAGLRNPPLAHIENGLHVVSIPPGSKRMNITAERIRELEEEMDLEYALRGRSLVKVAGDFPGFTRTFSTRYNHSFAWHIRS